MGRITVVAVVSLVFTACDAELEEEDDIWTQAPSSDAQAQAESLYIEIGDRSKWNQHPSWDGVELSLDGEHGDYVQIWLNDAAMETVDSGDMVPGSIVVKEGYVDRDGSVPIGLTAMQWNDKEEQGSQSDWFWASYSPESGAVLEAGDLGRCAGCHGVSDSDGDGIVFDDQ